jgi:flagellar hook-length control protein FliK
MPTLAAVLQVPTTTPTLEATPGLTAPGTATELASDDFVLALTQALSTAAPPAAVAQAASVIVSGTPLAEPLMADEPSTAELAASFAGLLSLPLMTPSSAPAPSPAIDPLELLGVSGAGSRAGTAGQPTLQPALQAVLSSTLAGAPALDSALTEAPPEVPASQPESSLLLAPSFERPSQTLTSDAGAVSRPLQHNVGAQAWTEELGTRVTVMAERGQHSASLRLSPEHLGPLEIRIAIRDDQASVWFGAAHADTRAAIEHALPRLREMFAAQGMSLTDAGVSREPPREPPPTPGQQGGGFAEPGNEAAVTIATVQRIGLIDAYA